MLQIAVHDHDAVARRIAQTGGDRDLFSEIAAERDGTNARIASFNWRNLASVPVLSRRQRR